MVGDHRGWWNIKKKKIYINRWKVEICGDIGCLLGHDLNVKWKEIDERDYNYCGEGNKLVEMRYLFDFYIFDLIVWKKGYRFNFSFE